jgi:hypothetical protein
MRVDALRVTVGVSKGEVIVLFGVFAFAGDCWAEVLKGSHQQVVQKELRVLVHALAGKVGRSRVRGVPGLQGFACRVVVDQSPGSGVRSRVDSQIEAGHHLFGRFLEAQKAGALVCMVGVLLDRGTGLHLGEVETGAASRHDFGSDNDPKKVCVLLLQDLLQSCARGGRRRVEDMCYERRRAEACVDESAQHALVNAGGREIV